MRLLTFFTFLLFSLALTAQDRIAGSDLIARLDKGENIALTDVTITGDLDFTKLADREEERKDKWGKQKAYRTYVRSMLSFENCTFTGEVIGYYSPQDRWGQSKEPMVNTDFDEKVAFINCTFKEAVLFKYSNFDEMTSFQGAAFQEKVNFKYTKFEEAINFSGAKFDGFANFKYTNFDEGPDFSNADFDRDADFKYTKFPQGTTMANATFNDSANFKYTEFHGDTDLSGVDFGRDTDFKYTKKGGRSFRPGK
jgi:uncharacterized protein YjbI with pentapeptide repeats